MTLNKTLIMIIAALCFFVAGCEGGDDDGDGIHTVNKGGKLHGAELNNPIGNCDDGNCHGAGLTGAEGPSCTSCHGNKGW